MARRLRFIFPQDAVKNPVLPHGASSIEKAMLTSKLCGFKAGWPFIPSLPSGASGFFT